MLQWFAENWSTILVGLIVLAAVVFAVYILRRDKKRGVSSCGGSCGACPMAGKCHTPPSTR